MEADAICSECSDQGDSDEAEDTLANAVKSAPPKGTAEFERWLDDKSGAAATPALPPPPQDDEDFARWFEEGIASCPSFAEHEELLRECCGIVVRWRARFWQRKNLWARIRRGRRLYKELSEIAPVLVRVRDAVAAFELPPDGQKLVLLDLCSGFGYMAMFLSELLAPWAHKVDKIVLVDLQFAPHNVPKGPQHIDPEHLHADGWPIRLTTSRCDLKAASDRRNLCRVFLSHGAPAMLLGVHLCGTLSIRAVQLYNEARPLSWLALKPCCLPGMVHAQRREVFRMGCHAFPAHEVCVHGKWNKGRWVGNSSHRPASVEEVERKFDKWAGHLHAGVDEAPEEGGHKSLEMIRVQERWFQNKFIFSDRPFSPEVPQVVKDFNAQRAAGGDATPSAAAYTSAKPAFDWKAEAKRTALAAKHERRRLKREEAAAAAATAPAAPAAEDNPPPPRFTVDLCSGMRFAVEDKPAPPRLTWKSPLFIVSAALIFLGGIFVASAWPRMDNFSRGLVVVFALLAQELLFRGLR